MFNDLWEVILRFPLHISAAARRSCSGVVPETDAVLRTLPLCLFAVLFTLLFTASAFSAKTVINTARADYSIGTVPTVSYSSIVSLIVRTPSTLEYLKYAPLSPAAERVTVSPTKYLDTAGSHSAMPDPAPAGSTSPLDVSKPVPLIKANVYHGNEPLFLRLSDGDQNIDPTVAETILLNLAIQDNGEKEALVLLETGLDTGVFVGYVQSVTMPSVKGNGVLSVHEDTSIVATYVDPEDSADTVKVTALIDPFGTVFDSKTGQPVDGITVTVIDTSSGNPAVIYGDDGVSIYPATVISGGTVADSSGVVYTFKPGSYRFPFVQLGKYRLAVTPSPAYRAPSTVPTPELLALGPFAIEPGSRGEEFVVDSGPALHIDIPVDPVLTSLYLTKAASKNAVAIGDFLQYKITVENTTDSDVDGILVSDRMPLGFRYRQGSTRISGGAAAPDPAVSTDGRSLTFNLGSLVPQKTAAITYVVEIAAGAKTGKAINLAAATGSGGAVSNTARAVVLVKEDLFGSKTIIMGRVFPGCDNSPPPQSAATHPEINPAEGSGGLKNSDGVAGVRIYLEDGTYTVTDKKGMYHFEGLQPGTHIVQLDIATIPKDYELISCAENDRFAGTPYSQFVDLQGGTLWRADFYTFRKPEATVAMSSAEKEKEQRSKARAMPEFDSAWLGRAEPGLAFVWPDDGFHPPIPSVRMAVKHDPGKKLRLLLNGKEVDPLYLDRTTKRGDNQIAVSLWIGIHVKDGDNLFEAVEYGQDGNEEQRVGRTIHYSGPPVKAELVPAQSRLTADGKTPTVIAVRLKDKEGHPAREGVNGEYKVDPPYLSLQKLENLQHDPLTVSKSEGLKYVVGEDGIALIELQPTSRTGEAVLRFNLVSGKQEVHAWLTPEERDWIIVGLAEGTAGYNRVSGNMESLGSDVDDKYYQDGRLAFFAKGMIKGKWLLTLAYDSDRNGSARNNDSLHQIINPHQYYTLYGDATQQGYEATSARGLYVKLERDKFYALFGDFETGLNVTELSRYSRNLNGMKSAMKGERFDFNFFASDTNQAFVKDEIRGDGTSGLYRLSRKNIVMNSESLTIETRDRFRSEVIISSQKLSRYIDYSIDYETGSIYFKSPVYSRDENFNPVTIVVDYESFDSTDMSFNYGGRGAVRFMDNRLEIGATHIHEGSAGGEGNLEGLDATLKINDQTSIKTEIAATNTDVQGSGRAFLGELAHRSEKLEGKAYFREQEEKFGLGQQRGSETGTRKLGFDGAYRWNEKVTVKSDLYRQYNLSVDAVRNLAEARVRYAEKKYDLHGGLRHAADELGNGEVNRSEQITGGGSLRLLDDRLTLRLDHDQSVLGNANSDFPTRTTLGADYKLNDTAALFAAQEFTQGENEDTQTSRIGMKASPWSGGQISTSLGQQYSENGARVFAVAGLQQAYKINSKWSIDAGMERSSTLKHPGNDQFNFNVPASAGGEDFTALSLGTAYKEEKWSWTGRIETRNSQNEDRIGVFSGGYGEFKEGVGLAAALQAFKTGYSSGAEKESGDLRFGLAYRPKETSWIILDRLDFLVEKQSGVGFAFDNRRIINNINANYQANRKTQLALQYGSKYVQEGIDNNDYRGYTDLTGLEGRYDVTKKWDIGLRAKALHSWSTDQFQYGTGVSVGHSFVKNLWLSVGYNFTGFRDRDFSRADFTAQGPFIKFRMKFDQGSVRDAVKRFTNQ